MMNNIFEGKFQVLGFYIYVKNEGWVCTREYNGAYTWTFGNGRESDYLQVDNYCGDLCEHYEGASHIANYVFFCVDMRLYIHRPDYGRDNSMTLRTNSCYKIEQIDETEYWLYDLEDPERNEGTVRFKLKIKRME